jgi:ribonuclease HI
MTHIFTDGACLLNTKGDLAIGLCGFYNSDSETFVVDQGLSMNSNAYQMELKGVYLALQNINCDTVIFCDSLQVIDTLKLKAKKLTHHLEFLTRMQFELIREKYDVDIRWIKGHGESAGNNTIDQKLEQEMVKLIGQLQPNLQKIIVQKVKERYEHKGCFENFSQDFFDELIGLL